MLVTIVAFALIASLLLNTFLIEDSAGNASSAQEELTNVALNLIIYVVTFLLMYVILAILAHGLVNCIAEIEKNDDDNESFLKNITNNIKTAIKLYLKTFLRIILILFCAALIETIFEFLFGSASTLNNIIHSFILIISYILICKVLICTVISDFIAHDNLNRNSKELYLKGKEIINANFFKVLSMCLASKTVFFAVIINIVIQNVPAIILAKQINAENLDNSMQLPSWWNMFATTISIISFGLIIIRTALCLYVFYRDIKGEKAFEEDYQIEKGERKYIGISIGLVILLVVVVLVISGISLIPLLEAYTNSFLIEAQGM